MVENTIKLILPYIKGISWTVIIAGTTYILYNRSKVKIVSLKDITEWANQNKGIGTKMFVSKLDAMPMEVRKQVQQEIGLKRILNGYKDDTSIFVTIIDDSNNIISSSYFLGTKLDEELIIALGNKTGINIKLN